MDISIIVPVYNVEKYLTSCLNSLLNQKFTGTYEVIAVDDGSTDTSLQILLNYQKNDGRLKVIPHKENKKLSMARSTGMNFSTGNYIMHVDSDDWLLPDALEKLFNKSKETNADVIVYNYLIKENNKDSLPEDSIKNEMFTSDKYLVQKHFFGGSINKLVKRHLTEDLILGTIGVNNTEDLLYCYEILYRAKTFYLFPEILYVYFRNKGSLTNSTCPVDFVMDQVIIINQIKLLVDKYGADVINTENLLDYLDKWLYLRIAQMHFGKNVDRDKKSEMARLYHNLPLLSRKRSNKLKQAITNRFFSVIEVSRRFKIITTLGILTRYFRKYARFSDA